MKKMGKSIQTQRLIKNQQLLDNKKINFQTYLNIGESENNA